MTSVYGYNTPGNSRVFFKETQKPYTVNKNSVLDFISNHPDTSLFAYIVELAGLTELLDDPMFNSTVFIPRDSDLVQRYNENMFKDMSPELAFRIVKYSILGNKIEYWTLRTLNYSALVPKDSYDRIEFANSLGKLTLNEHINVLPMDTVCVNGVILFTDDLLVPYTA